MATQTKKSKNARWARAGLYVGNGKIIYRFHFEHLASVFVFFCSHFCICRFSRLFFSRPELKTVEHAQKITGNFGPGEPCAHPPLRAISWQEAASNRVS